MKISKLPVVFLIVVMLLPAMVSSSKEEQPESDMQRKLDCSSTILDGLVTENFDKILSGAETLNELGKHKWLENESAAYRTQNQVFWFTTGTLVMAAQNRNIDGATLAYTQMTHSCVNCHKLIRTK